MGASVVGVLETPREGHHERTGYGTRGPWTGLGPIAERGGGRLCSVSRRGGFSRFYRTTRIAHWTSDIEVARSSYVEFVRIDRQVSSSIPVAVLLTRL